MTHLNTVFIPSPLLPAEDQPLSVAPCLPTVVVVSDNHSVGAAVDQIGEFLGVGVVVLGTEAELAPILRTFRPMAVVTDMEGEDQDGCHVMMLVAYHDPDLPILLLTGDDPSLAGAADAVEELWGLSAVTKAPYLPGAGPLIEFLFHAGRRGECGRLIPA
jgi:hypothetical protein